MKKIILFAILLVGGIAFTNAQCASKNQSVPTEQVVSAGDFKEVALTDLSDVIQASVKNLAGDTFDVKKVEFNAENELTKVTLVNKADASEKCVILDKDGKEVKPDEAPAEE
jgi:hypothetical protein